MPEILIISNIYYIITIVGKVLMNCAATNMCIIMFIFTLIGPKKGL